VPFDSSNQGKYLLSLFGQSLRPTYRRSDQGGDDAFSQSHVADAQPPILPAEFERDVIEVIDESIGGEASAESLSPHIYGT